MTRPTNPRGSWPCYPGTNLLTAATTDVGVFKQARRVALTLVVLAGLAGCAHYPANAPKTADRTDGYYYQNQKRENNSDDILFLLAFSGGGTRASAFSCGVLEALRDISFEDEGKKRRFLDEVDVISSVSGGSVTSAAYGLYGDRVFEVFEPAFLKDHVVDELKGAAHTLLYQHPDFKKLMTDLGVSPTNPTTGREGVTK